MDPKKARKLLDKHEAAIPQGKARSAAAFKRMNQKKWNNIQRTEELQQLYKKVQNLDNEE